MESRPEQNVFYKPRVQKPDLSVVIPMYNERAILSQTLNTLRQVLPKASKRYEIILVDDNSKDDTLSIALDERKKDPSLGIAAYAQGPSRRENLCRTFSLTRATRILLLDMDLAMNPSYIPIMLRRLDEGYAVIAASRYAPGARVVRSPHRYLVSRAFNVFVRTFFRTGIYDNCCGFKAFQRDAIITLAQELGIDPTGDRGVFWDTELLIRARRLGLPLFELPIFWVAGKKSELRFKREARMVKYIIRFFGILAKEDRTKRIRGLAPNPLVHRN